MSNSLALATVWKLFVGFLPTIDWQVNDEYYSPYRGWSADVYTGPFNSTDLPAFNAMVQKLQSMVGEPGDLVSVTSWWSEFKAWLGNKGKDWTEMSPTNFSSDLANFLHSVRGARFARDFRFAGDLDCQQDAPPVLASRFLLSFSSIWDHKKQETLDSISKSQVLD